jgi:2-oxo-4-hydroxy-4-carboxy-5-ureidoimidazoline decarboxylase
MQASRMDKAEFVAVFGDIFEHSAWIAGQVWDSGLDASHDSAAGLHSAFADVIHAADQNQKLSLLLAHPELGLGMASEKELTAASQAEQRGAGLDRCSSNEFAAFQSLNESYRARFGFPFIMAVKGYGRSEILEAFRTRLVNTPEQEAQEALEQVIRIGLFRIESKFE